MYRQTTKYKQLCSKMGNASAAARERIRLEGPPVDLPRELPELRREIIVIDLLPVDIFCDIYRKKPRRTRQKRSRYFKKWGRSGAEKPKEKYKLLI